MPVDRANELVIRPVFWSNVSTETLKPPGWEASCADARMPSSPCWSTANPKIWPPSLVVSTLPKPAGPRAQLERTPVAGIEDPEEPPPQALRAKTPRETLEAAMVQRAERIIRVSTSVNVYGHATDLA